MMQVVGFGNTGVIGRHPIPDRPEGKEKRQGDDSDTALFAGAGEESDEKKRLRKERTETRTYDIQKRDDEDNGKTKKTTKQESSSDEEARHSPAHVN